jgi:hypothetical protein
MLLQLLRGDCGDGKTCPGLHRTDRGTVVIQGWAVTVPEADQHRRPAASGEEAIEVPAGLVAEVLHTCPALRHTGHGTVVIHGWPVTDPQVLRQLRLPAGEHAIEVPAELLAEVLQAC